MRRDDTLSFLVSAGKEHLQHWMNNAGKRLLSEASDAITLLSQIVIINQF